MNSGISKGWKEARAEKHHGSRTVSPLCLTGLLFLTSGSAGAGVMEQHFGLSSVAVGCTAKHAAKLKYVPQDSG